MSTKSEQFLEELERTHIVLFHDGNEETKKTEYGFIKRGLEKGDHCFYTTQKPQKILEEMKSHQVNTDSELLHIVEIPEKFEDYSDMILDKVCLLYTSDAADDTPLCRSRWSPYH